MITNVDAVTVFNGRTDRAERRKVYSPTVIHGVSCVEAKGSSVADNGVWSADVQYKMRIPVSAVVQANRAYLPEQRYAGLEAEDARGYWTISRGDLIIKGEYAGEKMLLYEDELQAYAHEACAELIRVTEYADNTTGGSMYLRHWRIGGK